MNEKISVVICTHNRALMLREALESLSRATKQDSPNLELIVVNNASSDQTDSVVTEWSEKAVQFSVKLLRESRLGKTYALNSAIKSASGDVLVFIDDDHLVDEGFFSAIWRSLHEKPNYNLYCGKVLPNWDGTEPEWVHDGSRYPIRPFPIPCFDLGTMHIEMTGEKSGFLPGAGNLIVRSNIFQQVGLFCESLGPKGHNLSGGEDIEFLRRALTKGEKILYDPKVVQYHQVETYKLSMRYLVKKAYLRSMAAYQFSEVNKEGQAPGFPLYLLRLAVSRFIRALFSFNRDARRYYFVRLAATIGELQGRRKAITEY